MQQCFCGAASCRGYIGVNKKVETALIGRSKKKTTRSHFVVERDVVEERGECWGHLTLLNHEYLEIWKMRSFMRDDTLFLMRNFALAYQAEYGRDQYLLLTSRIGRGTVGPTKLVDATMLNRRRRSLCDVLRELWDFKEPEGFIACVVDEEISDYDPLINDENSFLEQDCSKDCLMAEEILTNGGDLVV